MMAFMRVLAMALALASSSVWSSHPFESARNQYEAREDRPQPPQLLTEATDRPEVHLNNSDTSNKKSSDPDLQVGCGDGFIQEKREEQSESDKNKLPPKATKRRIPSRQKRSYTPWSGQITYSVPYSSINIWQPPVYQLSRPYYVPVYGAAGRPPIYFPPQPLYINPGVPKDNPQRRRFQGPPYLPPVGPTTERTTTMSVFNRFNGGDSDDDRPIWDLGENQVTQRPVTTTVVPTRRTRPPGVPKTHPPLIHGGSSSQDSSGSFTPPPPPARPPATRPSATTIRTPIEPSRCVWAIISCCSASEQIVYDCFEQRGCSGAFWDSSPCDSQFAQAAIAAALNYYEKK